MTHQKTVGLKFAVARWSRVVGETTTRGFLVVSAGAFEIANVIQGSLKVFWFYFLPFKHGLEYVDLTE